MHWLRAQGAHCSFCLPHGWYAAVNAVYAKAFAEPFPARSCVQVAAIPKGAKLEIECIAVRE